MLINLMIGLPAMLLCLMLQALFVAVGVRQYARFRTRKTCSDSLTRNIALLSAVMLVMLVGNSLQTGIWAALFLMIGEFDQFATALYFSGVTFATLGYGDIVMSEQWRLLSAIEAANGILMFGVSTAVMTAAVMDVMKRKMEQHSLSAPS